MAAVESITSTHELALDLRVNTLLASAPGAATSLSVFTEGSATGKPIDDGLEAGTVAGTEITGLTSRVCAGGDAVEAEAEATAEFGVESEINGKSAFCAAPITLPILAAVFSSFKIICSKTG